MTNSATERNDAGRFGQGQSVFAGHATGTRRTVVNNAGFVITNNAIPNISSALPTLSYIYSRSSNTFYLHKYQHRI